MLPHLVLLRMILTIKPGIQILFIHICIPLTSSHVFQLQTDTTVHLHLILFQLSVSLYESADQ